MNRFIVSLCFLAIASAHVIKHIPSGSVSVNKDGALVAGPAGSIHTDNGLHSHAAGARLSGPSGDVRTRGGHVTLHGPGNGHDDGNWGGDDGGNDDGGNDDGDDGQWQGDVVVGWGGNDGGNDGGWGGNDGGWGGNDGGDGGNDGDDGGNDGGDGGDDGDDGQWGGDDGQWGGDGHVVVVAPIATWGHGHQGW